MATAGWPPAHLRPKGKASTWCCARQGHDAVAFGSSAAAVNRAVVGWRRYLDTTTIPWSRFCARGGYHTLALLSPVVVSFQERTYSSDTPAIVRAKGRT